MSKITDQATAIAAVISAASNGKVYNYRPMPKGSWNEFLTAFTVTVDGQRMVRAWTVQYMGEERVAANIAGTTLAKQTHYYTWKIRYYQGWDDPASELVFRDHLELVADALDSNRTLGDACIDHDPVDIDIPANGDGVVLGDYLCHLAELNFRTWDQVNFSLT